jgi:hypothetical protein
MNWITNSDSTLHQSTSIDNYWSREFHESKQNSRWHQGKKINFHPAKTVRII